MTAARSSSFNTRPFMNLVRLARFSLLSVLLLVQHAGTGAHAKAQQNHVASHGYYVDCSNVRDGNGDSSVSPWNSLAPLQSHVFAPGDVIHLRRGTACHGTLAPKGSGAESAPARITAYDEGPLPKIIASQQSEEAFRLFNQQYWDIDSLDLSGGSTYGIFISGDRGILHHIHLANLAVHDVLGGEMKNKDNGLVVVSPGSVDQHFDDVLIDGVTAWNTHQWAGIMVGGGNLGYPPESTWSTSVVIRNSMIHDVQGDGIVLFRVREGLIDSSVAWNTGMQQTQTIGTPNAIWTWMCRDCVVSHNEAFLTDSPGVDGGAFDIDYGNTNNSVLDNFGHDTQGYCVAVFGAGFITRASVVRDNVCIGNGRSPRLAVYQGAIFLLTWNGGALDGLVVENNTVYWNPPGSAPALLNNASILSGTATFRQNTIYSTSPFIIETNRALSLDLNRYWYFGDRGQRWKYGGEVFHSFEVYQRVTHQDSGSSLLLSPTINTNDPFPSQPVSTQTPLRGAVTVSDEHKDPGNQQVAKGSRRDRRWRIFCSLPAQLSADGLLDADTRRQLIVLKSLGLQFPSERLAISVELFAEHQNDYRNALADLQMRNVTITFSSKSPAKSGRASRVELISPGGKVRAWTGFAGPAQIGFAVRQALGSPLYSQMEAARDE
jgi:hypothetical protein